MPCAPLECLKTCCQMGLKSFFDLQGDVEDIIYDVNEEEMRKTLRPGEKVPTV